MPMPTSGSGRLALRARAALLTVQSCVAGYKGTQETSVAYFVADFSRGAQQYVLPQPNFQNLDSVVISTVSDGSAVQILIVDNVLVSLSS